MTEQQVRDLYQKLYDNGPLYTKESLKATGIELPDDILTRIEAKQLKEKQYIEFGVLSITPAKGGITEYEISFTTAEDL